MRRAAAAKMAMVTAVAKKARTISASQGVPFSIAAPTQLFAPLMPPSYSSSTVSVQVAAEGLLFGHARGGRSAQEIAVGPAVII